GAYACGVIAIFYLAVQRSRGIDHMNNRIWPWSFALLNIGMLGMVGALLISGIAQAFYERAQGGSTLQAFVVAQENPWFVMGMYARLGFGLMFASGYFLLVYDLLTAGRKRPVPAGNLASA
ncbi:MAG TPA: hypothetical protein VJ998_09985, partial [Pseudomonadales bacterium]|nr:hypothetical protein [Pseudomonadales bacterium]